MPLIPLGWRAAALHAGQILRDLEIAADYRLFVRRVDPRFVRYLALQVPGWILIVVLGAVAQQMGMVGWPVVGAVLIGWMIKDLALYPLLRPHLFAAPGPVTADLVGRKGTVVKPLAPEGYVKVGNERWRARAEQDRHLPEGEPVRIVSTDGTTLTVTPDDATR